MPKKLSEMTQEELDKVFADLEGAQAQIKAVNAESAERRVKLKALEDKQAKKEQESLSEAEKLQAEIKQGKKAHEALKAELDAERIRTAVIGAAIELEFASPDDAFSLIDRNEIKIEDGKVVGFEKSLKALAESGRLAMKDSKKGNGLGTPSGKGKPASKGAEQEAPNIRL